MDSRTFSQTVCQSTLAITALMYSQIYNQGIELINKGSYIDYIIKRKNMYKVIREFVCGLTGDNCVVVEVDGGEICLEKDSIGNRVNK